MTPEATTARRHGRALTFSPRVQSVVTTAVAALMLAFCFAPGGLAAEEPQRKPNVIVIVADDLGYADLGFTGSKDTPTPHLDRLAASGVSCSNGYVTAPQCSPMRAGMLTGRYQQRFGHEFNTQDTVPGFGLPVGEKTIADRLKAAGYVTGLVGKWHLGLAEQFHPLNRGFDEHFGFLGGSNHYLPEKIPKGVLQAAIFRNGKEIEETEYLTDAFTREAVAYIDRHASDAAEGEPFFLYLAYNAPHTPEQATEKYLSRVKHIRGPKRRAYAAMICAMDDGVGAVMEKLRSEGLEENTLVFFLSDNGGQLKDGYPRNTPFRGSKGEVLEGGVRVPFLVRWKGALPLGTTYEQPVSSLDILPTALAAAGVRVDPEWELDGVNLLPYLRGEQSGAPHEYLFWRFQYPPGQERRSGWAVRRGDWKLVHSRTEGGPKLYNLARDIGETTDLAAQHPDVAQELRAAWDAWNATLAQPAWGDESAAQPNDARPKENKNKRRAAE